MAVLKIAESEGAYYLFPSERHSRMGKRYIKTRSFGFDKEARIALKECLEVDPKIRDYMTAIVNNMVAKNLLKPDLTSAYIDKYTFVNAAADNCDSTEID
jgi:hypothetical protein